MIFLLEYTFHSVLLVLKNHLVFREDVIIPENVVIKHSSKSFPEDIIVSEFSSLKPYSLIKMPLRERVPRNHILPVLSARSSDPDTWDQINPLSSIPHFLKCCAKISHQRHKSKSFFGIVDQTLSLTMENKIIRLW